MKVRPSIQNSQEVGIGSESLGTTTIWQEVGIGSESLGTIAI